MKDLTPLESLMLATACHFLPAEMREIGRAGCPRCGHGQHQVGSTSKIGPPS